MRMRMRLPKGIWTPSNLPILISISISISISQYYIYVYILFMFTYSIALQDCGCSRSTFFLTRNVKIMEKILQFTLVISHFDGGKQLPALPALSGFGFASRGAGHIWLGFDKTFSVRHWQNFTAWYHDPSCGGNNRNNFQSYTVVVCKIVLLPMIRTVAIRQLSRVQACNQTTRRNNCHNGNRIRSSCFTHVTAHSCLQPHFSNEPVMWLISCKITPSEKPSLLPFAKIFLAKLLAKC